ncbi:hypothetical protein ACFVKB_48320 [Rhodococcus sp. NPDC127530]|uniref:hypothetical protein n=1 Tax=Rhodococcus sp. NPDC127530 TaxID=3345397 RepID=UPI0036428026
MDEAVADACRHQFAVDAQSGCREAVSEIDTEAVEELLCELVLVFGDTAESFNERVSRLRPPELRENLCNGGGYLGWNKRRWALQVATDCRQVHRAGGRKPGPRPLADSGCGREVQKIIEDVTVHWRTPTQTVRFDDRQSLVQELLEHPTFHIQKQHMRTHALGGPMGEAVGREVTNTK